MVVVVVSLAVAAVAVAVRISQFGPVHSLEQEQISPSHSPGAVICMCCVCVGGHELTLPLGMLVKERGKARQARTTPVASFGPATQEINFTPDSIISCPALAHKLSNLCSGAHARAIA